VCGAVGVRLTVVICGLLQWNRPVHEFLLRHVYLECLRRFGYSRFSAMLVTFFVSIVMHEVVCGDPRLYVC
jgi:hypothetical protein